MELLYRACRHGCMKQAWFSQLPPQVLHGTVPAQLICASASMHCGREYDAKLPLLLPGHEQHWQPARQHACPE